MRADVCWLPEVLRLRAAYDEADAAVTRLRAAARLAVDHGSVTLVRRCEHDLAQRSAHLPRPGVRPVR
jgi:hypothetical protein